MKWGPRWTLRVGAVLMAIAPLLDQLIAGPGAFANGLRAFPSADRLHFFGEASWRVCWLLPLAASFPRLRENLLANWGAMVGSLLLMLFAMAALYRHGGEAVPGCLLMMLFLLSLVFLTTLGVAQVEFEIVSGWARILLFGSLAAMAAFEVYEARSWTPLLSVFVLLVATLVCGAGELWAIAAEPPYAGREEPEPPPA